MENHYLLGFYTTLKLSDDELTGWNIEKWETPQISHKWLFIKTEMVHVGTEKKNGNVQNRSFYNGGKYHALKTDAFVFQHFALHNMFLPTLRKR